MAVYLVSYKLDKKNLETQEHNNLVAALKSYDDSCRIFDNQWFVCSEGTADDIHGNLTQYLHKDDYIFIIEMGDNYRGWMPDSVVGWLSENI